MTKLQSTLICAINSHDRQHRFNLGIKSFTYASANEKDHIY